MGQQSSSQQQKQSATQYSPLTHPQSKEEKSDDTFYTDSISNRRSTLFPGAKSLFSEDANIIESKGGWFAWNKKKEVVKKESNLKCLCG